MKRKRTGLDEFVKASEPTPKPDPTSPKRTSPPAEDASGKGGTVYRPPGGVKGRFWRKVREIAFEEDTTAQALITEGLRFVLQQRTGRNVDDLLP